MNNKGYVAGEYESHQEKLLEVIRSVNKDKTLIEKIVNAFSEDSELKEYVIKEWESWTSREYDVTITETDKYKVYVVYGCRVYEKDYLKSLNPEKCYYHDGRKDGLPKTWSHRSCSEYDEYYLMGKTGTQDAYWTLDTEEYLNHIRETKEIHKKYWEEYDKKYPYGKDFHDVWKDFI